MATWYVEELSSIFFSSLISLSLGRSTAGQAQAFSRSLLPFLSAVRPTFSSISVISLSGTSTKEKDTVLPAGKGDAVTTITRSLSRRACPLSSRAKLNPVRSFLVECVCRSIRRGLVALVGAARFVCFALVFVLPVLFVQLA